MWSNQSSLKNVVPRVMRKAPPYCANPKCYFHIPGRSKSPRFQRYGSRSIKRFPFVNFRYRCLECQKVFSSSFFEISYRDKREDFYEEILDFWRRGASKRETAEFLDCDVNTVIRRFRKIARWSLLTMAKDQADLKIKEPVAYDGIENFSFSQHDPNNVNHTVGKESFYVYDFNFVPLNRKGKMSPSQKLKEEELQKVFGPYPKNATEEATKRIFERLLSRTVGNLHLHSDNHYAYRRALAKIKDNKRVAHFITPAKVARNYRNRLFPINHFDMLTRHHLSSFKRETIAFCKTSVSMMEDFAVLAAFKNYMRPKFKKPHVRDPRAHKDSPAMRLGLRRKILSFREMFACRITRAQVNLSDDWDLLFLRIDPHSRRPISPYHGI